MSQIEVRMKLQVTRGNLLEETYLGNYKIKNYYDNNDNLIKIETSGGGETLYNYDERGNLLEKLVKIQGESYSRTTFTYDEYGRTIEDKDPEGNLIKEINPNYYDRYTSDGLGVEYEYDINNRRIKGFWCKK